MSQVNRRSAVFAVGFALVALLAVGCSKKNGVAFDPDAGHPESFFPTHPTEYRNAGGECSACHGSDLLGGIAKVSCFSTSRDGQACHPGGPGGHAAGWRSLHTATNPSAAASCAACHDNPSNNLAPDCFNNSLCHGPKSGHPAGWLQDHTGTDQSLASSCAACHQSNAGTPGCFNNTLCHGEKSSHPDGWSAGSQHGGTAKAAPGGSSGFLYCESCHGSGLNGGSANQSCLINSGCHSWAAPHAKSGWDGGGSSHRTTNEGNATVCAQCHQSSPGTPNCFNNTLCHGSQGGHPAGWSAGSQHGATAKAAPGGSSGFLYCESCHGSGLNGGSANQSCLINSGCHGWSAPHASSGWNGGGSSHRSTNQGNAPVCAQCHQSSPGTANCFNNTLCHGGD